MIVCDNCNVCVTKHTFCSDKCRVAFHRKKIVVGKQDMVEPPREIFPKIVDNLLVCKHGKEKTWCTVKNCENYVS